jgi:hypothetical protein
MTAALRFPVCAYGRPVPCRLMESVPQGVRTSVLPGRHCLCAVHRSTLTNLLTAATKWARWLIIEDCVSRCVCARACLYVYVRMVVGVCAHSCGCMYASVRVTRLLYVLVRVCVFASACVSACAWWLPVRGAR